MKPRDSKPAAAQGKTMNAKSSIDLFLAGTPHAVAGASRDRSKYGNKVLRVFQQNKRKAFPINPFAESIEGQQSYPDLSSLPEPVHGVSLITPPAVSEQIVREAIRLQIRHLWFQPGAESDTAVKLALEAGMNVIHGGPCILVALHYHES